ncbi:MAG: ACT domain-containing protein, partial [Gammaproteobacteria bacterium]
MRPTQIKSTKPIKTSKNLGTSDLNLIALGEKSINLPKLIAALINKHNCTIMHSKILELGEDLTFAGSISGKWNEIIKLEKSISNLIKKYPIHIYIKRNNPPTHNDNSLDKPYI